MIHGNSKNHISKTENIFGRIKWLLCGLFREFKKCHKKLMESNNQEEKLLAVFAKGLISFIQNDYLQIKKEANALRKTDWEN